MINHVVLLNWYPGVGTEIISKVTRGFEDLAKHISEIKHYSFGPNLAYEGANFEYALVAQFADKQAFDTYTVHPLHQAFMKNVTSPIVASYASVQYLSNE